MLLQQEGHGSEVQAQVTSWKWSSVEAPSSQSLDCKCQMSATSEGLSTAVTSPLFLTPLPSILHFSYF